MTAAVVVAVVLIVGIFAWRAYTDLRPTDVWLDRGGNAIPATKVTSYPGAQHCDWQDLVFLEIGYRSGLTEPGLSGKLTFMRDPEGVLADHVAAAFEPGVRLHSGAVDTGWKRDGQELWLDPEGWAAYFQVDDDEFERWPRSSGVAPCL